LIPGIGKFNWPISMLTWDIIVLNGYLLINLHVVGYLLYTRFRGVEPNPKWYVPFVFLSIIWAISIHTVTAFLYCGLGGRPYWNTALLAPRFLASAFVSGPAFILIVMRVIRIGTDLPIVPGPARLLVQIIRIASVINLLMLLSELFTLFYAGGGHVASAKYLFFGDHGKHGLVPWIWSAIVLNVVGTILFFTPAALRRSNLRIIACVMCVAGIWIEKGMGLIVPGFIPSTLHEVIEYAPSVTEWKIAAGIWAFGLLLLTVMLKVAVAVFTNRMTLANTPPATASAPPQSAGPRPATA
jgi:molybdopterin-containing oxidoreductase family membrane subunit